jgi:hypothetical protein
MKKAIVAMMCMGLFVAGANANSIYFYFSTSGSAASIPAEWTAGVNPTLPASGGLIYLWAYVPAGDVWNGVNLTVENSIAGASPMYNPTVVGAGQRWNNGSDLDFYSDKEAFGVAVEEWGLGNASESSVLPAYSISRHFRVGQIDFASGFNGAEYLHVGNGGIARHNGGAGLDTIYFGFAPDHTPDGPILNNAFGVRSQYPDIIPEPAGLVLFALGAAALRQRKQNTRKG